MTAEATAVDVGHRLRRWGRNLRKQRSRSTMDETRATPNTNTAPVSPVRSQGLQPYRVHASTQADDPAWDDFLREVRASHTQSSSWGQVKGSLGWRAARVVVRRDDDIVGGAQVLIRPVTGLGGVGYIANGPVLASGDPALLDLVLRELRSTARRLRVQHVTMQPPRDSDTLSDTLARRAYLPSTTRVTPQATVLLDLTRGTDALLAGMSPKTRYNAQLGPRRGIVIREGTQADLVEYGRLLRATAERQRFTPLPEAYFASMWERLHPRGQVRLTMAELDGEVLAAQLAVAFGDTVTNKMSVWSGQHGRHRPNEALQWATIRWAAEQGYRWYDFEGIDLAAARLLLAGDPLPTKAHQSVTSFKLGFGGQVVVLPPAYDDLYNPVMRTAFATAYPLIRDHRAVRRLVKKVRTTAARAETSADRR
jgi:lipid II:glycine glycyltransferase (peptidoglycan interpeptide bridge formation enzyme)